jgi:hypothetical protein
MPANPVQITLTTCDFADFDDLTLRVATVPVPTPCTFFLNNLYSHHATKSKSGFRMLSPLVLHHQPLHVPTVHDTFAAQVDAPNTYEQNTRQMDLAS